MPRTSSPPVSAPAPQPEPAGPGPVVGALLVAAPMLLVSLHLALFSAHKYFWADEIFSYYQVDHRSAAAVLDSLRSGLNLMPPLWFLLAWKVQAVLGPGETTLRALSSLFLGAAVPVLGWGLWRSAGKISTLLAVSAGLLSSSLFLLNNTEARPYGLMFFWVAALAALWLRTSDRERVSPGYGPALALVTAGLISTHYVGGLYALLALAAHLAADRRRRWWRPGLYGAYVGGALIASAWILPILRDQFTARAGEGTGWIPAVTTAIVRQKSLAVIRGLLPVALTVGLLWCGRSRARKPPVPPAAGWDPAPLFLAGAWLALPVACLLVAWVSPANFFVERYFFPSLVGWVVAFAWVLAVLGRRWQFRASVPITTWGLAAWILAWSLFFLSRGALAYGGFDQGSAAARLHPGPQITANLVEFAKGKYFSPPGGTADWRYLTTVPGDVAAFRRFHPTFRALLPAELATLPGFILVDAPPLTGGFDFQQWLKGQPLEIQATLPPDHAYLPARQQFVRAVYVIRRR